MYDFEQRPGVYTPAYEYLVIEARLSSEIQPPNCAEEYDFGFYVAWNFQEPVNVPLYLTTDSQTM